jgi:hypothetical protein
MVRAGFSAWLIMSQFRSKRKSLGIPEVKDRRLHVAPVESDTFGLRLIHQPKEQTSPSDALVHALIDVIFVHGLGGSSQGTWTHPKSGFWPTWLQEQKHLENVCISTFGYDANWDPTKPSNALGIADFARKLLMELKLHYTTSGKVILLSYACLCFRGSPSSWHTAWVDWLSKR